MSSKVATKPKAGSKSAPPAAGKGKPAAAGGKAAAPAAAGGKGKAHHDKKDGGKAQPARSTAKSAGAKPTAGKGGKSAAAAAAGGNKAAPGGGKENEPQTPRGVAFQVDLGEGEPKGEPPARLKDQGKEKGGNLTKEELERKMEEAEKRRSQVQEMRIEKIKDVTMSGFIGKPEVPPEDQEEKS